jgi:hypothetical protein
MSEKTIGEIIENEVRKQQLNITEFADDINCKRNNVYDIFKRNNIDIQLLARISKVLNRNFFQDLAERPDLVGLEINENEKENNNRKAVSQFLDVMPRVLNKLDMESNITFTKLNDAPDVPLPDVGFPGYGITFTIGERLYDKAKGAFGKLMEVKTLKTEDGILVDIWTNILRGTVMIDLKLDYKTEDEWYKTIKFVKENCLQYVKLPIV